MADEKTLNNNPDAQFRFAMSEDGMKLGVSRYFPPSGGREPSVQLICEQVAAAGVQLPVDEEAAQRVVDAIYDEESYTGIALVRGIPHIDSQDAAVIALGDLDFPVFPEDRFARFRPALEAAEGQTIDGRVLTPTKTDAPTDMKISMGENVNFDPTTESYVAEVWGMARLKDGTITVDPVATISEDLISVTGNLYHKDFKGEPITPARVEKVMRDMGVVIDLDLDMLDARLKQAADMGLPIINTAFAQGSHPVPGRDGWLEYLVSTREETGTEDEAGRLDFRDRGAYPMVNEGQLIGRLHPPTSGEGGIDIYGMTVPAHEGQALHIHLGENVLLQEDGRTYQSKAKGVVAMDKSTLSVTECLVISGNVDMNSGNVKVEHGSVKVLGSVQAGFSVAAPNHVIVMGSIESASIYAGGLVEVSEGILMPEGGQVVSDGEVIAGFVMNANIKAGADITIGNEIQNSVIHTDGKLIATNGKGTIQGGTVTAKKGIEVNELGSELGVATLVGVEIEHHDDDDLKEQRIKITQAIKKIDEALGTDPAHEILMRTPVSKRPAVGEVLKHRSTLEKKRKSITKQINELQEARLRELEGIDIKVRKLVHPGTTIRFGKMKKEIAKRMEACTIYWDLRNRTIAVK